jgi:hypothetical protein
MTRQVQRVELKSNHELVVFVGALSALEAIEFGQRLKAAEKTQDIIAEQIATFVRNEDGTLRFTDAAAAMEFLKTIRPGQMKKIIEAGTKFNELNDEAIEDELKN